MNKKVLFLIASCFFLSVPQLSWSFERDVINQFSTIDASLSGIYDGETTMEEAVKLGDFGLGTPGDHLHFLTKDMQSDGHVLAFSTDQAVLGIDQSSTFTLHLPADQSFMNSDLKGNKESELHKVEK